MEFMARNVFKHKVACCDSFFFRSLALFMILCTTNHFQSTWTLRCSFCVMLAKERTILILSACLCIYLRISRAGMLYLHSFSPPICHAALKSSNILFVSQCFLTMLSEKACILLAKIQFCNSVMLDFSFETVFTSAIKRTIVI